MIVISIMLLNNHSSRHWEMSFNSSPLHSQSTDLSRSTLKSKWLFLKYRSQIINSEIGKIPIVSISIRISWFFIFNLTYKFSMSRLNSFLWQYISLLFNGSRDASSHLPLRKWWNWEIYPNSPSPSKISTTPSCGEIHQTWAPSIIISQTRNQNIGSSDLPLCLRKRKRNLLSI